MSQQGGSQPPAEEVEPPPGRVYKHPIRPWHDQQPSLAAAGARVGVAVQIYNRAIHHRMLARLSEGGRSRKWPPGRRMS